MKTTTQTPGSLRQFIVSNCAIIINRTLLVSTAIVKYSYWFLSVFIFFSCQKTLMPANKTAPVVITQHVEKPVEKFTVIDTTKYSFSNRITSLPISDSLMVGRIAEKIKRFYKGNAYKTKWMNANGPDPLYYVLFDQLKNADHHGLDPAAYNIDLIEQSVNNLYKNKPASSKDVIDVDVKITEAWFLFAIHLREGKIGNAGCRDKIWIVYHPKADHSDVSLLLSIKNPLDLSYVTKKLQPAHEQYAKLQRLLVHYRSLEKYDAGQLPVSSRESIKAGSTHVAIPAIRKKLLLTGISIDEKNDDTNLNDSLYYDNALVSAVKFFQQMHGLEQDGIISGKTLAYLNQSFKKKADLIALNMERMRWLPEQSSQYIRVNIPEYVLRIYEQETSTLEMKVIVGAVSTATPVFSDTLEHVVFSPTWTVPPSLVKEEFIPRLRKNKMYYAKRKDFTFYKNGTAIDPSTERWDSIASVHQYRVVQKPGADNALGLAKFIMPNNMNIYLHDTPDHKLFSQQYRAFSHGCIRLDDPARFAAYILDGETDWDLSKIKNAMAGGQSTKIALRKKYPVHLEYRTVWVDDSGNLHFGEDIYGHDKRQLEQLRGLNDVKKIMAKR